MSVVYRAWQETRRAHVLKGRDVSIHQLKLPPTTAWLARELFNGAPTYTAAEYITGHRRA